MDMNKGVSKKVSGGDWRGIELNWITSGDPENDGWAWRRLRQGGDYCTIVPSISTIGTCSVPSISTKSYFVSLCVTNGTQMKWMIKVRGTTHSRGWQGNRRGETESRHQPADQVHYAQNAGKQKQENINISQPLINMIHNGNHFLLIFILYILSNEMMRTHLWKCHQVPKSVRQCGICQFSFHRNIKPQGLQNKQHCRPSVLLPQIWRSPCGKIFFAISVVSDLHVSSFSESVAMCGSLEFSHLVPGSFHPESGTWHFAPGIWHLVLFTWNLAPGTLHLESGTWYFAPGTWNLTTWTWQQRPGLAVALAPLGILSGSCLHLPDCRQLARHYAHFAGADSALRCAAALRAFCSIGCALPGEHQLCAVASFVLVQQWEPQLLRAKVNISFFNFLTNYQSKSPLILYCNNCSAVICGGTFSYYLKYQKRFAGLISFLIVS